MRQIGLVVAGGTGPELAQVFRDAATAFGQLGARPVGIRECAARLVSFTELGGLPPEECARLVKRDLAAMLRFYRSFYGAGGRVIFRTAVNAETLYALRRRLQAIKLSHVSRGGGRISFVRDQHQGFYACTNWEQGGDAIRFEGSFRRAAIEQIYRFAAKEAARWLGPDPETWFVYKHHLFGNTLSSWVAEICPRAQVLQPGMAYSKLSRRIESGGRPLLLIAGNEIGDMLHEVFLEGTGNEHRETAFSSNVYLHPAARGLVEYQTVHGSADDLEGLQRVNPLATLRAAAAIFDRHAGLPGIAGAMEQAAAEAGARGFLRHPAGITQPTGETAAELIRCAAEIYRQRTGSGRGRAAKAMAR